MALQLTHIKQVQTSAGEYEIAARTLLNSSNVEKTWEDIEALVSKGGRVVVLAALPEATAATYEEYKDAIVLIPKADSKAGNLKDEYVIVQNNSTYAWEKIGDTEIDLSNYVQKGSKTISNSGGHSHSVTGSVDVPTITKTPKYLSAAGSSAVTGVKSSDTFMKSAAHSVTGGTPTKQHLEVTSIVPAKANGTVTPAVAIATGSRPTKTVLGADTTASKVTIGTNTGAASKATAGTAITYGTADVGTEIACDDITNWSAGSVASTVVISPVVTNGVLSFNTATQSAPSLNYTARSIAPAVAASSTQKITPYTFTPVDIPTISASDVTVPVISSNNEVEVAKAGTAVSVATVDTAATVATGSLVASGTGAEVMTGIDAFSVSHTSISSANAITELNTGDVAITLTANDTSATGRIAYLPDVTVGTASASLKSGTTSTDGAHDHTFDLQ